LKLWKKATRIPVVYGDNPYASTCLGVHGIGDIEYSDFCRSCAVFVVICSSAAAILPFGSVM
jgi:hypothetical protein